MPKVGINKPAPDIRLEDFNKKPVNVSDFHGKKHVLLVLNRGFT
jgi:peroxiredoxin